MVAPVSVSSPVSPAVQPPPGNPRFELVDALRALAVVLVVFCHASQMSGAALHASWGWLGTYSYFGVILFFAISGFLLYRPFALAHSGGHRAPRAGVYARRRLLRILPAYWLALTILSIWPGVEGAFTDHWWVYYGFAQVYSVHTLTNGLAVAWSLCVEMSFYLFLPFFAAFVAWLVARRINSIRWWQTEALVLAIFACFGVIGQIFVHDRTTPYWVANTLGGTSDWFVAGMSLAVMSVAAYDRPGIARRLSTIVERWSWLVWLGGVASFLAATRIFDVRDLTSGRPGVYGVSTATWIANHIGLGVAAGLLLAPAVLGAQGPVRWLLSRRPLVWLGLISYGVFLWHFPLAAWLGLKGAYPKLHGGGLDIVDRVHTQPTLVLFLATFALSIIVAAVSYYVVELPFLRLKDRRGRFDSSAPYSSEPPLFSVGNAETPSLHSSLRSNVNNSPDRAEL
jgi:peptidoglycan/LPS O-acetylase OafA/YrhL